MVEEDHRWEVRAQCPREELPVSQLGCRQVRALGRRRRRRRRRRGGGGGSRCDDRDELGRRDDEEEVEEDVEDEDDRGDSCGARSMAFTSSSSKGAEP